MGVTPQPSEIKQDDRAKHRAHQYPVRLKPYIHRLAQNRCRGRAGRWIANRKPRPEPADTVT